MRQLAPAFAAREAILTGDDALFSWVLAPSGSHHRKFTLRS
jgi:hypothetical protein